MRFTEHAAKWDVVEITLDGPSEGNPYLDVALKARFCLGNRSVLVPGFYDGNGVYRIRFMPDTEGVWSFTTESETAALNGHEGGVTVSSAREGSHGPVQVRNRHHFGYADGTPFYPFGTTCYAWTHQPRDMQAQTLETLKTAPFNKVRMCVFPKDYPYNENEPLYDVFMPDGEGGYDYDRPNFEAFRHLETQVAALGDLGIEADIILFHPYDRWGYCTMSAEEDYRYLAYVVSRLAAYRNVWWSLANEYDFLLDVKPMERWHRFFQIIEETDPSHHLKSIHNGDPAKSYDHRRPWVDHVCIQNWDVRQMSDWRRDYGKPVVVDECEYEGDIVQTWGSITAQELVHRFWVAVLKGGYAAHGETYSHPEDLLWWAKGGTLRGDSPKRIAFLRQLIEQDVVNGLTPIEETAERVQPFNKMAGGRDGDVTYIYFAEHRPRIWSTGLPTEDGDYEIDIIDPWNMTITPARRVPAPVPHPIKHGEVVRGGKADAAFGVELPGKPNLAVRVRKRK